MSGRASHPSAATRVTFPHSRQGISSSITPSASSLGSVTLPLLGPSVGFTVALKMGCAPGGPPRGLADPTDAAYGAGRPRILAELVGWLPCFAVRAPVVSV